MKRFEPIEDKLIAARRMGDGDGAFVDQVMDAVRIHAINGRVVRTTNEQLNKETFIMKLRALPIPLLVVIALALSIGIGGASYAAIKLIEANKPAVKESHIDQDGKTELTTEDTACGKLEKEDSQRYEIKEGIDLPASEAAKYINAHCHLLLINERLSLRGEMLMIGMPGGVLSGDDTVVTPGKDTLELAGDASYYDKDVNQTRSGDFVVGDEVLAYRRFFQSVDRDPPVSAIFRPVEALKYYDADMQQNIRTIEPCENNAAMDCVVPSNYNAVTLIVSQGGPATYAREGARHMQGRLIEHTSDHFTLANNGHKVTFQTPYDVIARYNETTVYGLAQFDSIYANTSPDKLKIASGDSLSIYYVANESENIIPWTSVGTIMLMVEREPSDISLLRKY